MKHIRAFLGRLCVGLVALTSAAGALANAGRVDFAVGDVSAQQASAQPRPLVKGAEVLSGDKIVVRDGRAQIRFNDGAYVSLLPNTEFHIRDYRYSGKVDGTERSWTSLLRGTVRAVSGLVGRVNKAAYQIETPTATLGIRGTAGIIEVAADGTTKITTTSGIWTMTNRAGTMEVPAGQAGITTPNQSQAPQRTAPTASAAPPASNEKPRQQAQKPAAEFVGTADTTGATTAASTDTLSSTPAGTPAADALPNALVVTPRPPLQTPQGHHVTMVAVGATQNVAGDPFVHNLGVGPMSLDAVPRGFQGQSGSARPIDSATQYTGLTTAAGTVAQWGTSADKTLGWGRWDTAGGSSLTFHGQSPETSVHFVRALPALNIPTTGTATFNLVPGAGTTPTNSAGYTGLSLVSGQLALDFGNPGGPTPGSRVTLVVNSPLDSSSGSTWNIQLGGPSSGVIALKAGPGGANNLFGSVTSILGNAGAAQCTAGCGVSVSNLTATTFTSNVGGVITGERPGGGGTQAGMVYRIAVTSGVIGTSLGTFGHSGQTISGVAVFARP